MAEKTLAETQYGPQVSSITSSGTVQPDQKHRSSGNFSLEEQPKGTFALVWSISNNSQANVITFDVMKDLSVGIDSTIFSGLGQGSVTATNTDRSLYIANPKNTGESSFLVTANAITEMPPNAPAVASVVSDPKPSPDQKHRSSSNFSTEPNTQNGVLLYWEVTNNPNAPSITFDVMKDVVGFDSTLFTGLKSGSTTKVERSDSLYIANPQHTGGQNFTVTVKVLPNKLS